MKNLIQSVIIASCIFQFSCNAAEKDCVALRFALRGFQLMRSDLHPDQRAERRSHGDDGERSSVPPIFFKSRLHNCRGFPRVRGSKFTKNYEKTED